MDAVAQLFQSIPLDQILIQTINGIVTGMILALVASGLTLIFGIMDVVNFAHGELFMLGAYIGVLVLAGTGSFWIALVVATLMVALLGAALQIVTLRPLLGRDPLTTILATFGISLILQNYALWQFGPVARKIQEPITSHFHLFYLEYPWYRLLIAALSAAIIGAFWLFLKFGKFGIWIRATTQDRVMAQAMGIPVPWVTPPPLPSALVWQRRQGCCSARSSASTTPWGSIGCSRPSSWSWSAAWAISAARSRRQSSSA
jgi:branched-chain amino acid transport system permease protein